MKDKFTDMVLVILPPLIVAVMVIGLSLVHAEVAEALQAGSARADNCSLPYVTDVNPYGKQYVATVEVVGKPSVVKAYCSGKQVKIDRLGKNVWMLPIKKGKLYTIKAKANGGKWKTIQYKLVRC